MYVCLCVAYCFATGTAPYLWLLSSSLLEIWLFPKCCLKRARAPPGWVIGSVGKTTVQAGGGSRKSNSTEINYSSVARRHAMWRRARVGMMYDVNLTNYSGRRNRGRTRFKSYYLVLFCCYLMLLDCKRGMCLTLLEHINERPRQAASRTEIERARRKKKLWEFEPTLLMFYLTPYKRRIHPTNRKTVRDKLTIWSLACSNKWLLCCKHYKLRIQRV
jgi:hypothetical protein